jgi:membrane protease YdiL (CAAX protease family)
VTARPRVAVVRPAPAEQAREGLSWLAVPAGFALLLSRTWLAGPSVALGLAATFAALAALSLAGNRATVPMHGPAPSPVRVSGATRAAAPVWAIMGVGAVAVLAAAVAGSLPGPALPIPGGVRVLALVVGAAVAEEAFFRRLLYGRLLRWGAPVAVIGSAVAFGIMHVPLHGVAALPVDLGAGALLSWQRWASGSWAAPAATHALANVLAVLR